MPSKHQESRTSWEDSSGSASGTLARLARRYELLPLLWAAVRGQKVDRQAFDIEWNSPQNQACWITTLEHGEIAVLARVLRRVGKTAAMVRLAEKLAG